jgi:hypothetical protein
VKSNVLGSLVALGLVLVACGDSAVVGGGNTGGGSDGGGDTGGTPNIGGIPNVGGSGDGGNGGNPGDGNDTIATADPMEEDTLVENLSGGWKKRIALARELMRAPQLLLLDEPTNHLDVEGILWLESLLEESSFATLTITHDRLFLQRISNRIIELDRRHPGDEDLAF